MLLVRESVVRESGFAATGGADVAIGDCGGGDMWQPSAGMRLAAGDRRWRSAERLCGDPVVCCTCVYFARERERERIEREREDRERAPELSEHGEFQN